MPPVETAPAYIPMVEVSKEFLHPAYLRMAERNELIHDLLGGTLTMRKKGRKWLPQEDKEEDKQFDMRLQRAFCYPGLSDSVDDLSDRPFTKAVTLENAPFEPEFYDDVTGQGQSLSDFARDVMKSTIADGIGHMLIDHTTVPAGLNAAQEEALKPRPFFQLVSSSNLLFWAFDQHRQLSRVHILEIVDSGDGKEVEQIKVWLKDHWEIWREVKNNQTGVSKWELREHGVNSLGKVPLVTVYFKRVGPMEALPPLEGLAYTNLAHYQSSADQRNALRFARIGLLFAKGFRKEDILDIVIGPQKLISCTNDNGNLKYVEHTGKAMELGFTDLSKLERQMQEQGIQPLVDKVGDEPATATGRAIDDRNSTSSMNTWVRRLELGIRNAIVLAANWKKKEPAKGFKVTIYNDFVLPNQGGSSVDALTKLRALGDISRSTLIAEMRRFGVLSEDVTPEKEQEKLDKETPSVPPTDPSADKNQNPKPDPHQ